MNTHLQCSIQWNQWNLSQTWKWKQLPFFFSWLWSWVPWKFSWHRWIRANPALIDVARSYFPHLTASTLLGPFWTVFWGCLSLLLEFGGICRCHIYWLQTFVGSDNCTALNLSRFGWGYEYDKNKTDYLQLSRAPKKATFVFCWGLKHEVCTTKGTSTSYTLDGRNLAPVEVGW